MTSAPLLTATPLGDILKLHPGGSWTAINVAALERLSDAVTPQFDRSNTVRLDMADVRELDTLGAWLLEKMLRRAMSAGHRVDVTGVADNYAGLIEEVHQVNRRIPAPAPAHNPIIAKVSDIGRSAIGASEDVTAFLDMLGSLCIALLGVLRRPRSLRLTSLTYQLYRIGWQAIPIVVLITFLIGAIIAQQGIFHFRKFGADSYVVDMVGILVLRELGVLIVAIMVAGRSGSALHRRIRLDENARGNRRIDDHGARPGRGPDAAPDRRPGLRAAHPQLYRLDGRSLWRRPGGLVLRRHGAGDLHRAAARRRFRHPFRGRHHQGAVHGAGDRHRRLQRKPEGEGKRRVARQADHHVGREVDFFGDRTRRALCGVLCIDRNVVMQEADGQFAIRVHGLVVGFRRHVVIDHLDLDVRRGEMAWWALPVAANRF